MNVEIWADVICPWCAIGQARLAKAIAGVPRPEDLHVVHRSFQLDPRAPSTPVRTADMLRAKYGLSDARLQASWAHLTELAAAEGIVPYHLDNVVANTHLAHELAAFASARGQADAAWRLLYRAYFGERRSIFDVDALVVLAGELGLDADEARGALLDGRYRATVDADARDARELGVTGVPFVLVDQKIAVAGAQPVAAFVEAITRARA